MLKPCIKTQRGYNSDVVQIPCATNFLLQFILRIGDFWYFAETNFRDRKRPIFLLGSDFRKSRLTEITTFSQVFLIELHVIDKRNNM